MDKHKDKHKHKSFNINKFLPRSPYRERIFLHMIKNRTVPFEMSAITMRSIWGETFERKEKDSCMEYIPSFNDSTMKETKNYSPYESMKWKWYKNIVDVVENYYKNKNIYYTGDSEFTTICPIDILHFRAVNRAVQKMSREEFNHKYLVNYDNQQLSLLKNYLQYFCNSINEEVVNHYRHDNCGRYMSDNMEDKDQINIIGLPRLLRRSIFYGVFDYDMNNAHLSIIYNIMRKILKYDGELKYIEDYLAHKQDKREEYSERFNISVQDFKDILISLGNGARLDEHQYGSSIRDKFNSHKMFTQFINDDFIKGLNLELITCTTMILNHFRNDKGQIEVFGKVHLSNKNEPSRLRRSQFSFVLFMFESAIIKEIHNKFVVNALIYDGFMSINNYSCEQLSKHIKNTFYNFDITWSKERFLRDNEDTYTPYIVHFYNKYYQKIIKGELL